jgi:acyl carrier protein
LGNAFVAARFGFAASGSKAMSVRDLIETEMQRIAAEHKKHLAPIRGDLPLLQSGLDSLCFALLVANLEDKLGVDPFSASEDINVPVTFDDLVELYEDSVKVS